MNRPLHRISEVRRSQGVSLRTVARITKTSVGKLQCQENEYTDLPLSKLYLWCDVLEVPIVELLVEPKDDLSSAVQARARLIRLMKTATAILETAQTESTRRLADTLVDQLTSMMPELENVASEPNREHIRGSDNMGRLAHTPFSDHLLPELS